MKLSVLDLVPVIEGGTVSRALADAALLAQCAEAAGYHRYWVAEHHGMTGIAGGATSVVLAHVGHATRTIRIGAGGIMLPNHNPLVIAEQFGTLDALFPGRIDLGLGRAPGADQRITRALRKDVNRSAEDFPNDVVELQAQFAGDPRLPLQANPGLAAWPALCLCLALRTRSARCRIGALSRKIPAVGCACGALCDGRDQRDGGGQR